MKHGRGRTPGIDGRHCNVRARYIGMVEVAPGSELYTVAFACRSCGQEWNEQMSYNRAMVMREEQA